MLNGDSPERRWPGLDVAEKAARLSRSFILHTGLPSSGASTAVERARQAWRGLRERNPSTWSADAPTARQIANRLGWMDAPSAIAASLDRLTAFADAVRSDGTTDIVLLGMGGSSLAPEVFRAVLGVGEGFPRFHVLDSTDPAAVLAIDSAPARTLYVLASKSGTTIEPNSLAAHFRSRIEAADRAAQWGERFVAITDEGTPLADRARAEGFRELFINPSDIGGRYSALSYFGLVPAALMGLDVRALIGWGLAMLEASDTGAGTADVAASPSVSLGLMLGAGARAGRDKLTLVLPRDLEPFGLWIEQLVAESTGKHGVGILPVVGEALDLATLAAPDRMFACLDCPPPETTSPCFEARRPEPLALAAEMVRWEIATAVAGAVLDINPFDEPNVQQAKDASRVCLAGFERDGRLPVPSADLETDAGVTYTLSTRARRQLGLGATGLGAAAPARALAFLDTIEPGDYLAVLAYLGPEPSLFEVLAAFRATVHEMFGCATTFGYGPRYLHSTGQLHKGGPNTGIFIIVTAEAVRDAPVPGERFSFGVLERAQALGDFAALESGNRRVVHIHLPAPAPELLRTALDGLLARVSAG